VGGEAVVTWSATEAEREAWLDRQAPEFLILTCPECGARDEREVIDGLPDPCPVCESEEWER
jgi:hypothetical protein